PETLRSPFRVLHTPWPSLTVALPPGQVMVLVPSLLSATVHVPPAAPVAPVAPAAPGWTVELVPSVQVMVELPSALPFTVQEVPFLAVEQAAADMASATADIQREYFIESISGPDRGRPLMGKSASVS